MSWAIRRAAKGRRRVVEMTLILGTVKSRWLKSARRTAHLRARPLTAFDRKSKAARGAAA